MNFLTARWANLINMTWRVPPALLAPHTPPGVELDVHHGWAFASVVAFDFLETRVLGIPWPGYRDFPELNLRFYLKKGDQRGVAFIREYVPKRLIAGMARRFYNEPYVAAPMYSRTQSDETTHSFELGVEVGEREHVVRATGTPPAFEPAHDTLAHYFKEHRWGFGTTRSGRTLTYEVDHPVWRVWPVQSWSLDVDFSLLYGPEWEFLATRDPCSVVFAEGSRVSVAPKGGLEDVTGEPMSPTPEALLTPPDEV